MQWLIFGLLTTLVAAGVTKVMRDTHELLRGADPDRFAARNRQSAVHRPRRKTAPTPIAAQDTVQCPGCKAYVVKGMACCGLKGDA